MWAVQIEVPKKRTREAIVVEINKIVGARELVNLQIASAMRYMFVVCGLHSLVSLAWHVEFGSETLDSHTFVT